MADSIYNLHVDRDPRLLVQSKADLAITKGSSSYNFVTIQANERSPSLLDFQFQPPSESVVIPRRADIESTMTFQIVLSKGNNAAGGIQSGTNVFSVGLNACLQSYPLHRLSTHAQILLNNGQIDMNVPNVLSGLLQIQDERHMVEYNSQVPIMSDRYARYSDAVSGNINNPFKGYENAYDKYIQPRGCHPINITSVVHSPAGSGGADSLVAEDAAETFTITFQITCVEPCLIPPFIAGKKSDQLAGFLGVNRLGIRYNLSSDARRVLSTSLPFTGITCTLQSIDDAKLHISYLNGDASQLLPSRIVHQYYQFNDYVSNSTSSLASGATGVYTSQNLQLSEIPDLFMLYLRKNYGQLKPTDPDVLLPISQLSVNFNNMPSLLSQMTPTELYLMSKRNGLNNVDYRQFLGYAQKYNSAYVSGASGTQNLLYLAGSCVLINPAKDLSIYQPFLTNSSTGQFNFNFTATVTNTTADTISSVDIVTVPIYLRLLETTPGFSAVKQPAFNQSQVALALENASAGPAPDQEELLGGKTMSSVVARGVGGSGSRSGGRKKDVAKVMSKLDSLLM